MDWFISFIHIYTVKMNLVGYIFTMKEHPTASSSPVQRYLYITGSGKFRFTTHTEKSSVVVKVLHFVHLTQKWRSC